MQSQLPNPHAFKGVLDDKEISLYILSDKVNGMQCAITNYGARLVSLIVPDRNGNSVDVALGYGSLEEYQEGPEDYMGAIVGRCANRIASGHFTLDGRDYFLPKNNGDNTLHGGIRGLQAHAWDVLNASDTEITLQYVSPDGEEGFPGELTITVTYRIEEPFTLVIDYKATTTSATPVSLSNHAYWNLSGEGAPTIEDHLLQINAKSYTPVDESLIPTGEIATVTGTPFHFCNAHPISAHLRDVHDQLLYGKGYDHNWVLDEGLKEAVVLSSPITGITMQLSTDQPGIQFYSGNFLDGSRMGKGRQQYRFRSAVALEPQHFPDSVNHPHFPSVILGPGEEYRSTSRYVFGAG